MRQRSLILVWLVVATFIGCGKDSDVAQITDLSKQLASDARDKDWKGVCDALSAKARAQITIGGVFLGGGDCAEVVARLAALDDDPEGFGTTGGDDVKVSKVKVTGDRATADVTPTFDDEDPTTRFVREDGEWKVDADIDEEGSSSTTTGDPSDDQTAAAPAPELRVADQGFSRVDGGNVSYGVVVDNPEEQDAVGVEVQINLLAADGGVAATETAGLHGIPAGESANIGGQTDSGGERITRLEITVKADSGETAGFITLPKVSRVRLSRDEFGMSVRAQVMNTLHEELSAISDVFAVLRRSDGEIVGGLSGYPEDDIAPGGRAAVELGGLGDVNGATRADVTADGETSG